MKPGKIWGNVYILLSVLSIQLYSIISGAYAKPVVCQYSQVVGKVCPTEDIYASLSSNSKFIGISFDFVGNSTTVQNQVAENFLSEKACSSSSLNEFKEFKEISDGLFLCSSVNASIIRVFYYTNISGDNCNLSQGKETSSCFQTPVNCSITQSQVLKVLGISPNGMEVEMISKSIQENQKLIRKDFEDEILKVKKNNGWSWKDYVYEFSIELVLVCFVFSGLIIIALKICMEQKMEREMDMSEAASPTSPRVVRFDFKEKRRRFSHYSHSEDHYNCEASNPPSKPILKNKGFVLHRVLGHDSTGHSFDSNNTIYYDALEGTISPQQLTLIEPLIPNTKDTK